MVGEPRSGALHKPGLLMSFPIVPLYSVCVPPVLPLMTSPEFQFFRFYFSLVPLF